mgnify:CR=1 FL=1
MNKLLFIVFAAFSAACSDTPPLPADPQATPETRALYRNLFRIADEGVMFGHQDDALYGHDWKYEEGRSDVRECCGDYPAVFGWELGGLETGADRSIDDVPFAEIPRLLCAAYGRGAVNTVSWHPQNPESGASAWDGKTATAVSSILPGGANHAQFRLWLDRLAGFFVGLKSADGTCVPVLFRPFHEHTGNGFWWGKGNCTAEEYIALWRFTLEYLRDTKGVHNLLYVYSPDIVSSQDNYLEFWPGDAYVDILGLDAYDRSSWAIETNGLRLMRLLKHIAYLKNKPFAFTETGLENNTSQSKWWTEKLSKAIAGVPVAYVLVWRNKDTNHFFGPYPGCVSEEDFKTFVAGEQILLEKDIAGIYE